MFFNIRESGTAIPEIDVLDFFFNNNVAPVECDDVFQVTLDLRNECGDADASTVFIYNCNESSIHYPDMVLCTNNPDVQIQGDISECPGCTYQWSPSQYIDDHTLPFPTIMGSSNANALFETYTVIATTPEGCKYTDDLRVNVTAMLSGNITFYTQFINHCEFEVYAMANFGSPVNLSDVHFSFKEHRPRGNSAYYPGVLMSPLGISAIGIYKLPNVYSRLEPHTFSAVASLAPLNLEDGFNSVGNCVIQSDIFTRDEDTNNIFVPDQFSPINQDGINDYFFPNFSHTNSSIWYAKFSVWDRFGGLMFAGEKTKTAPFEETGLRGDEPELQWDGRFGGQMMNTGTYTWVLEYSDCTGIGLIKEGSVLLK